MAQITFVSLDRDFLDEIGKYFPNAKLLNDKIQDYKPTKNIVYYISPANSLGFMDGGIDLAYSRIMFPGIEKKVKNNIKKYGKKNLLGRDYLPIGSAFAVSAVSTAYLICAPTMLFPQNVQKTNNAYWSMMAILNVLGKNMLNKDVEIIIPSMCCGYGKMKIEDSVSQIHKAFQDYNISNSINPYILEPNLHEQPKYYENREFFNIEINEIEKHI